MVDKQYILSESELNELDGSTNIIENRLIVKNFLKSKTPIDKGRRGAILTKGDI